ncbi:ArgE/DapE family deacylase [Nostocoides sp. F2B08]|uniref:ArgE/DapE family deacylase n=1 Tax=Nostocoides sp. F2B08 TaxID=2653936 RepID=UPI0012638649|nr:ArgE/DapE family deacylase [Tetrasphaera sp. F2B08]KAB7744071.1 ArgE/DapE family deacylase [Tetrasphaera sp. F2B08]
MLSVPERIDPSDLTDTQRRVLDTIDEQETVQSLVDLIRTPSVTGTDAESELQHSIARELTELGCEVDVWRIDLDALAADPDHPGTEAPRTEGWGVVGVVGPRQAGEIPALVLQGHSDVVPTGDLDRWPHRDPWSGAIRGGAVHGRGACDMKAGVAANLAVLRAVVRSGAALRRPLALHHVISEEDGGLGAFATLRRGHTGEVAVITEPTSGRVVVANAGALTFEIRVTGRAAHGSARLSGVSAFEAFLPIHAVLRDLERRRNADPDPLFDGTALPYALSVGRIRSGDWSSSVPDLLVAEGRYGVRLGEDLAEARRELEASVAYACSVDPWLRDHPAEVSWTGGQFAPGGIDREHAFVGEVVDAVHAVTGRRPDLGAAPYGSDLRLYAGVGGIPTLHYGPGDVRMAHAPREQVDIAELLEVTRALAALTVRRVCD